MAEMIIVLPTRAFPARIHQFNVIASYNWLNKPQPTILVPGIPPKWNEHSNHPSLPPDSGFRYIDQHADRTPGAPLEALVQAVKTCDASFDLSNIDIVTDRSPIRKLFGFVNGDSGSFSFGVDVVGDTALFTRNEKWTREEVRPGKFRVFRDSFEKEYTRSEGQAAGSKSHNRIVCYKLAETTFLVRSAVDAYLHDFAILDPEEVSEDPVGVPNIKAPTTTADTLEGSETLITVQKGGQTVPQEAVLELVTRSKYSVNTFNIRRRMPDLWISQTPNFVEAYYAKDPSDPDRAIFGGISHQPLNKRLADWEASNAETLGRLAAVVKDIDKAAKKIGKPCVVRFDLLQPKYLIVKEVEGGVLPTLTEDSKALFLPDEGTRRSRGPR